MKGDVNASAKKYREKTGGGHFRRLPAIFRTMPPMNFGSRMHTIRTRIVSPPACIDQRPACQHERRTRHGRPGPPRDAQEQKQQPCGNEHAPQHPPQTVLRRVTPGRRIGLIPDFPHIDSPASLAEYAAQGCQMRIPGENLCKDDNSVTFVVYKREDFV
jgi:hypothetical protein